MCLYNISTLNAIHFIDKLSNNTKNNTGLLATILDLHVDSNITRVTSDEWKRWNCATSNLKTP